MKHKWEYNVFARNNDVTRKISVTPIDDQYTETFYEIPQFTNNVGN